MAFAAAVAASRDLARERIAESLEREGEVRLGIAVVLAVALGAAGLREAEVDGVAVARAEPVEDAVEDALAALVLVEAERLVVVQVTRGLRHGEGVGVTHMIGERILVAEVIDGRVPQEGDEIARRGQAEPCDNGVLRDVRELEDRALLERRPEG